MPFWTCSRAADLFWPRPGSFGMKHLFDKQEVVSMGVGRRNDRTEWQSKELLAAVSLEWAEIFSGSHLRGAYMLPSFFVFCVCCSSWEMRFLPIAGHTVRFLFSSVLHQQWVVVLADKWRQCLLRVEKWLILSNISSSHYPISGMPLIVQWSWSREGKPGLCVFSLFERLEPKCTTKYFFLRLVQYYSEFWRKLYMLVFQDFWNCKIQFIS